MGVSNPSTVAAATGVVFDNRSIGQTDAPETGYTTDERAQDATALLDHLEIAAFFNTTAFR